MAVDAALARELRSHIGDTTREDLGPLTDSLIRRYARAIGDDNPLYHDIEHARSAGLPGLLAPPNLIPSIVSWHEGAGYGDLRADGTESGTHLPGVPNSGVRVMGGGEEMEFHGPACSGTTVLLATSLVDVTERHSRGGPMLVLRYRNSYTDADGDPILTTHRTVLLR